MQVQENIEANGLDDHLFALEAAAKTALVKALENHEKLWVEKAKIRWMKQGDRNSKFFHLSAKMKRLRNTIKYLKKNDGSMVEGQEQLGDYIVQFYEDFHKANPIMEHAKVLENIPLILQQRDIYRLDSMPGDAEIKRAMWELDPNSSPGLDGFSGAFFRRCWHIVERELRSILVVVVSSYNNGEMDEEIYLDWEVDTLRSIIVKWDSLCTKEEGGLGIRSLRDSNMAMLCKMV
ncbi:uncharacterized protein LOC122084900 [Macadamia integrifolia]|uniref:uncharacterized protein LOC122084900 n=1 Tax=Macadamia integrifolia TaxID=60698 RepID=UPI001C4F8519|nr:uncharacterized protein LOC122084900 [Macadamia integrifolia]